VLGLQDLENFNMFSIVIDDVIEPRSPIDYEPTIKYAPISTIIKRKSVPFCTAWPVWNMNCFSVLFLCFVAATLDLDQCSRFSDH